MAGSPEGEAHACRVWSAVAGVIALALAAQAAAEDYPTRPIRLICPQAVGRPTEFLSRATAEQLSQIIGQQGFVDNRYRASTMIRAELVAKANADGYTLLMATRTAFA